jgi:hypothetical protein
MEFDKQPLGLYQAISFGFEVQASTCAAKAFTFNLLFEYEQSF